jgi:hypothetical protein
VSEPALPTSIEEPASQEVELSAPVEAAAVSTPALPQSPQPEPGTSASGPPNQPLSFAPPPKKKRSRLLKTVFIVVVLAVIIGGAVSYAKLQAAKNDPDKAIKDALENSLSISSVESETTTSESTIKTKYDLSNTKNPIVSTKASIGQGKNAIGIDGYGSAKNTYASYTSLPKTLSKDLIAHTKNGWIQIRADGKQPKDVTDIMHNLSDPRYQIFGPVVTGNFSDKTRQQLVDFLISHKVYGYDATKVTHKKVGDQKMIIYPVKLDASYLKIASQSAAVNEGFDIADIQAATTAMDQLKGAKATLYINADNHTIARLKIVKDGKTKTIKFSNYDTTKLPAEPQTKLSWINFLPVQNQINSLTSLTKASY